MMSTGNKQIKEITGLTGRKGGGRGGMVELHCISIFTCCSARYKATLQPGWIVVYFVLLGWVAHCGPGLRKLSIIAPTLPWLQR